MNKIMREGRTAVLVNKEYGTGWPNELRYDPAIVDLLLSGVGTETLQAHVKSIMEQNQEATWARDYYHGPTVSGLTVQWVPTGQRFYVDDYDGLETIIFEQNIEWLTA